MDPFLSSVMARSALTRLVAVLALLAAMWLVIAWAVALP
jgi:hypothetical protein